MDITHTGVTVADLERSLWFYRDLMGMEVVRQYVSKSDVARVMWNAPGLEQLESAMIRLPGSGQEVQLTQATGAFGDRRDHLDANPWDLGAARLSLPVADLVQVVDRLGDNGFAPRAGDIVRGTQGATAGVQGAFFTDPNGLFVELLQYPIERGPGDVMHTGITVGDFERSMWFYRDALGMEVLCSSKGDLEFTRALWAAPELQSIDSAILRMPGFSQRLEITQVNGLAQDRLAGHQWDVGFSHVCFTLDDLAGLFELLNQHDIQPKAVVQGMIDDWVTGSHVPDPDGFDLELLQLP